MLQLEIFQNVGRLVNAVASFERQDRQLFERIVARCDGCAVPRYLSHQLERDGLLRQRNAHLVRIRAQCCADQLIYPRCSLTRRLVRRSRRRSDRHFHIRAMRCDLNDPFDRSQVRSAAGALPGKQLFGSAERAEERHTNSL